VITFDHFVEDALLLIDDVMQKDNHTSTLPVFLLGFICLPCLLVLCAHGDDYSHSMGGTIALHTACRKPSMWSGVILSGAAIMRGCEREKEKKR